MRRELYAAMVLIIFGVSGCAHYGYLEADNGRSYNMAKYGQVLNPAAFKNNRAPVTGLSGKAGVAALQKYVDSFGQDAGQGKQGTQTDSDWIGKTDYGKK